MDEAKVFALNFLQPLCKIAFRIVWIKWVLEVIRDVVSQLGVGTRSASGVRFDEVGKGFARGDDSIFIRVYLPRSSGLYFDGEGPQAVSPAILRHDLAPHLIGIPDRFFVLARNPVSEENFHINLFRGDVVEHLKIFGV